MYNLKKIGKQGFLNATVVFIVALTLVMSGSVMSVNVSEEKIILDSNDTLSDGVNITVNGTLGENGWYVSDIIITMTWDPEEIDMVYYRIDDGIWMIYMEPIIISEDGVHAFEWYCIDNEGNQSNVHGPFDLKIDQTRPEMNVYAEKIEGNTWLLIAEVTDETSGINRVEFYQGGELLGAVTEAPYVWEWEYSNAGHIHIIAYDYAGNIVICIIRSVADFTKAKATVDTLVSDNSNPSGCGCEGCELEIELIFGRYGITMIIKNIGDSDCTNVKWNITLEGGIILIGKETTGIILCIPPGENVTVSSGWIFGFGRIIITGSVECAEGSSDTKTRDAFVLLFFIKILEN